MATLQEKANTGSINNNCWDISPRQDLLSSMNFYNRLQKPFQYITITLQKISSELFLRLLTAYISDKNDRAMREMFDPVEIRVCLYFLELWPPEQIAIPFANILRCYCDRVRVRHWLVRCQKPDISLRYIETH